jgi:sucrose-6-phosphate hydrolase SacC (GH32 family)
MKTSITNIKKLILSATLLPSLLLPSLWLPRLLWANEVEYSEKDYRNFSTYSDIGYDQALRPQFHFTSQKNWLNDPNGMVYYDGEWHMYFQHNPTKNETGIKAWGNAKSTDLIHWKQYPHALIPYPNIYGKNHIHSIWSGSAVVDEHNALGLQKGKVKTLYAQYTATNPGGFFQGAAVSTDKGRTWELLNDGKPVIPFQKGFTRGQRDPRLFYYAPDQCYFMIMMIGGKDRAVRLWKSKDLQTWDIAFDIHGKAAECIDMYILPVDGDSNHMKWVISDANTKYEVGDFDGKSWKGMGEVDESGNRLKYDYGDSYYAAQAFNQGPEGRVVHVGWLRSKKIYRPFLDAKMPFTQQMSIPAEITLRKTPEGIRMFRNPVKEIEKLYAKTHRISEKSLAQTHERLSSIRAELVDMTLEFEPSSDLTLHVRGLPIHYHKDKSQFSFVNVQWAAALEREMKTANEKQKKRLPKFKKGQVPGMSVVPAPTVDGKVRLRVLVDRVSLELFVNDGQAAASIVTVPDAKNRSIEIKGKGAQVIRSVVVNELKSIWK